MSCANSTCKACNGTCDTEQSLCTISSQNATSYGSGNFNWPANPAGQPISKVWTATAWNRLRNLVTGAYNAGSKCSSNSESWGNNPMQAATAPNPITAAIFNSARIALNRLGGSIAQVTGGPTGTIIRAYHATSMANAYNNGEILSTACNDCNVGCDVTCDGCIGCVNCQGVEHYSTCYGSCN
jgi:hypothetical protein